MNVTVLFFSTDGDKVPANEGTFKLDAIPRVGDTIEDDEKFWDVTSVFWRVTDGYVTIHCALSENQG